MTRYRFEVKLKDRTLQYESTSYQTLYEHLYNDHRRGFEMYDILDIQLLRTYKFYSLTRGCYAVFDVNDALYSKLANEFLLDETNFRRHGIKSVDDYIRSVLSFNL